MKKFFVQILSCFITQKIRRKKFREKFLSKTKITFIGKSKINKNVVFKGNAIVYDGATITADDFGSITIGHDAVIGKNACISTHKNYTYGGNTNNCKISIGDNSVVGSNNVFSGQGGITIGKDVLFAPNVTLMSNNHGYSDISTPIWLQNNTNKEIKIGDDCWIGLNAIILSGVSIGKHCVIGAGSVVTKDVPDFCVAAGNPAKIIKKYNFEKNIWEKVC